MSNYIAFPKPVFESQIGAAKTQVKAGPCELHGYVIQNGTAAIAYVQVFDALAANVVVGTTVPDYVIPVPANGQAVLPLGSGGFQHLTGMTIACTTAALNAVAAVCDLLLAMR